MIKSRRHHPLLVALKIYQRYRRIKKEKEEEIKISFIKEVFK